MLKWTLLFFIIGFTSCNNQIKFDKIAWNKKDDFLPCPCRKQMIEDLTKNYKLIGIKSDTLKDILGEPDGEDSISLFYDLIVNYGIDIDPVYTKTLIFYFNKDSIINKFELHEWEK
jgi:hypothetical protein